MPAAAGMHALCVVARGLQQQQACKLGARGGSAGDLVVVSPDVGGVARARAFAKKLSDAPLAIVDKRRSAHNVSEVMNLIGDVKGKVAVLVDDMIDTAGTITNAAKVLHAEGAQAVYACATHAVFSPPAAQRLSSGAQPPASTAVTARSMYACMLLQRCRPRRSGGAKRPAGAQLHPDERLWDAWDCLRCTQRHAAAGHSSAAGHRAC
jgi:orotate phosphoribosyltransferase